MLKVWLILLALLVNAAVGILAPNPVCSFVATILFVVSTAALFRAEPVSVWLLLPFIWLQFSVLLSLTFATSGAYMPEMGETGHASTAAISYGLFSLLLIAVALRTRRALQRLAVPKNDPSWPVWGPGSRPVSILDLGLLCLVTGMISYLFASGLRTGFPLLTHTDRFAYRRLDANVLTVDILDLQLLPAIALGVARLTTSSRALRALYGALFASLLLGSTLFGDKFAILLMCLLGFLSPAVITSSRTTVQTIRRLLPAFGAGAIVMTAATLFIYSDYGALGLGEALDTLGSRISGQGELWYVTVEHNAALFRFDTSAVRGTLASVLYRNPANYMFVHRLGPYSFVELFSPPEMYHAFIDNEGAVTPTMGYEAYGLALFGYAGLAVQIVLSGMLLGALTLFIERELRSGNPLRALFPAFLLNASLKFFAEGTLFNVCSVPLFKSYAAFLCFGILIRILSRSAPPARDRLPDGAPPRLA